MVMQLNAPSDFFDGPRVEGETASALLAFAVFPAADFDTAGAALMTFFGAIRIIQYFRMNPGVGSVDDWRLYTLTYV
jgi:hypothetical protein